METAVTTKSLGLKWGLILGLMSTIISLVVSLFELYGNDTAVQLVSLILVVAAIFMAIKDFKDANEGFMTGGEGFGMSMIILSIAAVFSNIISYVYMKFIDPDIIDKIRNLQLVELEKQGLSDQEIEMAIKYSEFFMTPEMLAIMAFAFYMFFGAILALIMSQILKKNRPVQF